MYLNRFSTPPQHTTSSNSYLTMSFPIALHSSIPYVLVLRQRLLLFLFLFSSSSSPSLNWITKHLLLGNLFFKTKKMINIVLKWIRCRHSEGVMWIVCCVGNDRGGMKMVWWSMWLRPWLYTYIYDQMKAKGESGEKSLFNNFSVFFLLFFWHLKVALSLLL